MLMITSIGLSFAEIIGILAILGGFITAYTSLNVRIAALEVKVRQNEIHISELSSHLEIIRKENREDHYNILSKLENALDNWNSFSAFYSFRSFLHPTPRKAKAIAFIEKQYDDVLAKYKELHERVTALEKLIPLACFKLNCKIHQIKKVE